MTTLKRLQKHHRLMWMYAGALLTVFEKPLFAFLVLFTLAMAFGGAGVIYILELSSNPNIDSFFDAFYFIITAMTSVGFGDIVPLTALGRFFSILVMMLGTALFVSFTAVFASALIEYEIEHDEITNK